MLVPSNEDIKKLVKAFGVNVENCVSFTLKIRVDDVVSVEVETLLPKEDLKKGAEKAETVLKKYELVEKKEE